MSRPSPFIQVTPFLGVAAMEPALAFYRDILGFTVHVHGGGYAYVERERIAFRLLQLDDGAHNPPGCSHAYVVSPMRRRFSARCTRRSRPCPKTAGVRRATTPMASANSGCATPTAI